MSVDITSLLASAQAGSALAQLAIELVGDVVRAVQSASEADEASVSTNLAAARAALSGARADALAARAEGAAALKLFPTEEPKVKGDSEEPA